MQRNPHSKGKLPNQARRPGSGHARVVQTAKRAIADIRIADIVVPHDRMRKLRPETVAEIAESVATRGLLLQPIIVRPRGANTFWLVGGHHRLEAVRQCGHDVISAVIVDGLDADQALLAEIDENLIRADLSLAERALHFGRRKELYEKLYPETVSVRVRGGPGRGKKNNSQNESGFVVDTAKKTGKGRSTIARDVTRAKNIAVLADIVGTSLDEGDELDALAKLPEAEQRKLAERVKAGEKVTAKHVAKKLRRDSRERELAAATIAASQAIGTKLYGVIAIDVPRRFLTWAESGMDRAAENHYPTETFETIKALKLPAAASCVMFYWATFASLDQDIEIIRAMGFTYKSGSGWDKMIGGTGYWVISRLELILIATKGDGIPAPVPGENFPALFSVRRGAHSEKPDEVYQEIERLFPNVPKLEMFARKARAGWDWHGNEAPPTPEAAS